MTDIVIAKNQEKIPWSDERVELLKKLWTEGHSASQIAQRIGGGVTRNAVIGKVHRLNLSGRVSPQAKEPREPKKPKEPSLPRIPKRTSGGALKRIPQFEDLENEDVGEDRPTYRGPGRPKGSPNIRPSAWIDAEPPRAIARAIALSEPTPLRLVELPKDGRITILHLSDKTCKWPIGEPGTEDFCFCGHTPRDKSSYCEYHARAAYQPMQDRRHRKFG